MSTKTILTAFMGAVLLSFTSAPVKCENEVNLEGSRRGTVTDTFNTSDEGRCKNADENQTRTGHDNGIPSGNVSREEEGERKKVDCCKNHVQRTSLGQKCCRDKSTDANATTTTQGQDTGNAVEQQQQPRRHGCCRNRNRTNQQTENVQPGQHGHPIRKCCRAKASNISATATSQDNNRRRKREDASTGQGKEKRVAKDAKKGSGRNDEKTQRRAERLHNMTAKHKERPINVTIKHVSSHPELPKKYEEMIPTLNVSALLETSMLLNKFRESMDRFDDYADEVEVEMGLKISGRMEFIDGFDSFIHRAQYIVKLRLYHLQRR